MMWCAGGCTWLGLERLVTTRIVVKSAAQSLTEQIFGAYDELGEEVYLLAGVRSVDPMTGEPEAPPEQSESQRRALEARRGMEFNRDDVLRFKRLGYLGEGLDGLLAVREQNLGDLPQEDPWLFQLVREVGDEENTNRRCIWDRIIETTPELQGEDGLATLQAVMAEKHRQEAEPGMEIQQPDGTWVTKTETEIEGEGEEGE